MELTSALLHKGQVSWRALLLTALLLTSWNFATTVKISVEAVPPHVAEGDNVLFRAHNVPATQRTLHWFKGNQLNHSNSILRMITHRNKLDTGPFYSKRETLKTDGSLLFKNVTKGDAGDYLLVVTLDSYDETKAGLKLYVHNQVTQPSIQVTNTTVKGRISVFLTCLTNDTDISINWLFNGEKLKLSDRIRLSQNNSTLQINSVRSEDSGEYECEVSNEAKTKRSDPIELDIKYEPPKPKKNLPSSMDIITIVAQCLVGLIAVILVLVFLRCRRRGREPQRKKTINQVGNESTKSMKPQMKPQM